MVHLFFVHVMVSTRKGQRWPHSMYLVAQYQKGRKAQFRSLPNLKYRHPARKTRNFPFPTRQYRQLPIRQLVRACQA